MLMPRMLADMGVPMLFLAFPYAFYLLVPVIALETWFSRGMTQISAQRRFAGVVAANAFSTLVGWPVAWFALALLQLFVIPGGGSPYGLDTPLRAAASVTLQAAWLIPYDDQLYWMVPTAAMVLMVPAFFATIPCESFILKYCWPQTVIAERKRFVWKANLASYALLIAAELFWLLYSVRHAQPHA